MEFQEDFYDCGHPDEPGPKHIWDSPEYKMSSASSGGAAQNYWGLHMWRVCNHFTITSYPQGYNSNTWNGKPTCDFTGVNTYTPNTVGPFSFWGNPLCTRYWTGTSWAYNITGPTPFGYLPLSDYSSFNYFYDWAVQSTGPINVGDKIEFNCCEQQDPWIGFTNSNGNAYPTPMSLNNTMGSTGSGNRICLEYIGRHYIGGHPQIPPSAPNWGLPIPLPWPLYVGQYYWDGTYMSTSMMSATAYNMDNYPEENPTCCKNFEHDTSWDCVQIGDHPKFGFKCVEINGISGQFETKQECLQSNCVGFVDPGIHTGYGTTNPSGTFQPLIGGGTQTGEGEQDPPPQGEDKGTGDTEGGR